MESVVVKVIWIQHRALAVRRAMALRRTGARRRKRIKRYPVGWPWRLAQSTRPKVWQRIAIRERRDTELIVTCVYCLGATPNPVSFLGPDRVIMRSDASVTRRIALETLQRLTRSGHQYCRAATSSLVHICLGYPRRSFARGSTRRVDVLSPRAADTDPQSRPVADGGLPPPVQATGHGFSVIRREVRNA